MTTATPTPSKDSGEIAGALSEHLDEGILASLATQFFRALPGADAAPAVPPRPELGSIAIAAPAAPASPAFAPAEVDRTLPEAVSETLPPGNARPTPHAVVPHSVLAPRPQAMPEPIMPPTSPYYFLGEAGAQAPRAVGELPTQPHTDWITANPYQLPGEQDLQGLLADVASAPGSRVRQPASSHGQGESPFYFLEGSPASQAVPLVGASAHPAFDVQAIRRDFPVLKVLVHGRPLVWFDNAATTQKPQAVMDRLSWFYANENSNIHRAAHEMAARATDAYESARSKVARILGAGSPEEIIFVRGATEGINLVAQTFGKQFIGEGDEIVVSHLEHHANIVPWQMIAAEKGARLRVIPVDDSGQILLEEYRKLLTDRTKLVAVAQVSNALGTVTPVKEIIELAHGVGAVALIDGAQSISHMRVNVQTLDADFFVFSGHKVFGPTGIGAVYGKKKLLDTLPPWQGGGNMIEDVTFERTRYNPAPARFEAGTGNIADAVGLGAALDYLERVGIENVARYEHDLLDYAAHELAGIPGLRPIGTAKEKTSVLSFVLAGYSTEDVGKALNAEGIAVRTGHHCAQPILRRFGVEATVRPSIAFYNTCEEVDRMIAVLRGLTRGH